MNYILKMRAKHAYNVMRKADEQEYLAKWYEKEMLEEAMYSKKERVHILTPKAKEKIESAVINSMTFLYFAFTYGSVNFLEVTFGYLAVIEAIKKQYGLSVAYALIGGSMKVMEKLVDGLVLPRKGD